MPRRAYPPVDRVLARVTVHPLGCWEFTGCLNKKGYARVKCDGRYAFAHRVVYEAEVGPIPDGLVIDHLCMNTTCVNPAHLEAVTPAENTRRQIAAARPRARATHCRSGHLLDDASTYATRDGRRRCRACNKRYRQTSDARIPTAED